MSIAPTVMPVEISSIGKAGLLVDLEVIESVYQVVQEARFLPKDTFTLG
jgi:hypothetical protein